MSTAARDWGDVLDGTEDGDDGSSFLRSSSGEGAAGQGMFMSSSPRCGTPLYGGQRSSGLQMAGKVQPDNSDISSARLSPVAMAHLLSSKHLPPAVYTPGTGEDTVSSSSSEDPCAMLDVLPTEQLPDMPPSRSSNRGFSAHSPSGDSKPSGSWVDFGAMGTGDSTPLRPVSAASSASSASTGQTTGKSTTLRSMLSRISTAPALEAPPEALEQAQLISHFGGVEGDRRSGRLFGKALIYLTNESLVLLSQRSGRFEWALSELELCQPTMSFDHGELHLSGLGPLLELRGVCVKRPDANMLNRHYDATRDGPPVVHLGVRGLEDAIDHWASLIAEARGGDAGCGKAGGQETCLVEAFRD